MTVIERIAGPAAPVRATPARRTRGVFMPNAEPPADTAEAAAVAAPALTTLLELQEDEPGGGRKRRTLRRARDMLTGLAALQRALVSGADPAEIVRALSALHSDAEPTGDPALDDLVQSVGLRVRVELARHGL